MTAVTPVSVLRREQPARRGLPSVARNYLAALAFAAAVATIVAGLRPEPVPWKHFVILLLVAPAVQLFAEHGPGNQVFHSGLAFTVAAVLLLPPELAVLVCIVQHLPEWARQRYPWYIQTFNIVNYVLSALAAALVWRLYGAGAADTRAAAVAAAACSGAVFVLVNHTLLARMLRYARGRTLSETRLFRVDGLAGSGSLAAIGIVFAFTVDRDPLLAVLVALPLLLVQRALTVPLLRDEASRDHSIAFPHGHRIFATTSKGPARARRPSGSRRSSPSPGGASSPTCGRTRRTRTGSTSAPPTRGGRTRAGSGGRSTAARRSSGFRPPRRSTARSRPARAAATPSSRSTAPVVSTSTTSRSRTSASRDRTTRGRRSRCATRPESPTPESIGSGTPSTATRPRAGRSTSRTTRSGAGTCSAGRPRSTTRSSCTAHSPARPQVWHSGLRTTSRRPGAATKGSWGTTRSARSRPRPVRSGRAAAPPSSRRPCTTST
jgi:hypothetical protein